MSKKVMLCAISNISSGTCAEDCAFCAQSARFKADIDRYAKKPVATIVAEARAARANGAAGFCLVTAGKGLDEAKLAFVTEAARAVKAAEPDLNLIACNGTATADQLRQLKEAGVNSYNHNLETARTFYPRICSTHGWDERLATCRAAKEAGLKLCSGGIFGLGESLEERIGMLEAIRDLDADSTPLNFYHPNPALPLPHTVIGREEALQTIRMARAILPRQRIMIAGGRQLVFGDDFLDVFAAGAQAVVIGNYLTTAGGDPLKERTIIEQGGYEIALKCEEGR